MLHAISGSTNAVLHLIAYAGRVGVDLPLQRFDELSRSTPWLVNLKPAGTHLMEDFFYAGGLPAVMAELAELLHLDAITVTGRTVGENIAGASIGDTEVIRPAADPLDAGGSLVVLGGNLYPDGAVMKISAADPALLAHEGRAVVFEDIHDLAARVDDPELDCDASSVMVLRNAGPVKAPGMPEWGHLPIPAKLLKAGVTDLVRISDARVSGTSYGAVVLHVAPESAVGGPLRSSATATGSASTSGPARWTSSSARRSSTRGARAGSLRRARTTAASACSLRARPAGEPRLRLRLPPRPLRRRHRRGDVPLVRVGA